jgi:hypothetical protein
MDVLYVIEMLLIGAGVGLISNALGLGGGILMVPAFLFFVTGMDPQTAKGTSLFIIIFVAAVNSWRLNHGVKHGQNALAAFLAAGSIVGGYASAWFTSRLPDTVVIWTFVAFLAVAAVRTFLLEPKPVAEADLKKRNGMAVVIGLCAGIVSGATGTGGGLIVVPLVLMAGIVTNERAVAVSNMVMVATCIASTAAHMLAEKTTELDWTVGQVNVSMAPLVFIGAMLSAPYGRKLNKVLTLPRRRIAMGILLAIIAIRLVLEAVR